MRLLVSSPSLASGVEVLGRRWRILESGALPHERPYTCVSYVWGTEQVVNPLDARATMSSRVHGALEAVVRGLSPDAIWLDALCVPLHEPERSETLKRLGAIYGEAEAVAVVLSPGCAPALREAASKQKLSLTALSHLEQDPWITRAWTYQEIANAKRVHFVAESAGDAVVGGEDLLNFMGHALHDYEKVHALEGDAHLRPFPRLDDLETAVLEWRIAGYLEHSAYRVLSAFEGRLAERAEDRFNAALGAISAHPITSTSVEPAEQFMRACEAKGDLSFVYSTAPRSIEPGKAWRPVASDLRIVLPFHSTGSGQAGEVFSSHVRLDGMVALNPGPLDDAGRAFLAQWFGEGNSSGASDPQIILSQLRRLRFTGSGDIIELPSGYFFTQRALPRDVQCLPLVTTGVRCFHGAPGVLVAERGARYQWLDVGVFIGSVPTEGRSYEIAG